LNALRNYFDDPNKIIFISIVKFLLGVKLNSRRSLLKGAGSNAGEFRLKSHVLCSLDIAILID